MPDTTDINKKLEEISERINAIAFDLSPSMGDLVSYQKELEKLQAELLSDPEIAKILARGPAKGGYRIKGLFDAED